VFLVIVGCFYEQLVTVHSLLWMHEPGTLFHQKWLTSQHCRQNSSVSFPCVWFTLHTVVPCLKCWHLVT